MREGGLPPQKMGGCLFMVKYAFVFSRKVMQRQMNLPTVRGLGVGPQQIPHQLRQKRLLLLLFLFPITRNHLPTNNVCVFMKWMEWNGTEWDGMSGAGVYFFPKKSKRRGKQIAHIPFPPSPPFQTDKQTTTRTHLLTPLLRLLPLLLPLHSLLPQAQPKPPSPSPPLVIPPLRRWNDDGRRSRLLPFPTPIPILMPWRLLQV